jgi:hypothetical protein
LRDEETEISDNTSNAFTRMIARIIMISVVMFIERVCSLSVPGCRVKMRRGLQIPRTFAIQHGWKDMADVYDYLWGFLTWYYKYSYCTMVLRLFIAMLFEKSPIEILLHR